MSRGRFLMLLMLLAVAAFAGRAAYVLAVTNELDDPTAELGLHRSFDELYYQNTARMLADGGGFKEPLFAGPDPLEAAEHPPVPALALTPVALLTEDTELPMRLTVAMTGTFVVVLSGLVGFRVAGPRAGLLAAAVAAVYPNLWANDGLLMSETFGTLGTAAVLLCTYRLLAAPSWGNAVASGVACGVAMLARDELALLVPLLVVPAVLLMRATARGRRLQLAGIVALAAAVVVAPWVGYNLSRFERPVLLGYSEGATLLGANCDKTYEGPLVGYWDGECATLYGPELEQSRVAERKRTAALRYIGDHIERLPVVALARVGRVWSIYRPAQMAELNRNEGRPVWVSLAGVVMFWVLAILAVAGGVVIRRRGVALLPLVIPLLIVTLVAAAFYGLVRIRAPAEVAVVVLAAVGLEHLAVRTGMWAPAPTQPDHRSPPQDALGGTR